MEASNITIKQILCKIVSRHGKDWHTKLIYALWTYRTSVCMDKITIYNNLVYSIDAIMSLELEIPSLQIFLKGLIDDIRMMLHSLRLFYYGISSSTQFYICMCYGVIIPMCMVVYMCIIHESSISQRYVYKYYHRV